jgi:hypothetical protein
VLYQPTVSARALMCTSRLHADCNWLVTMRIASQLVALLGAVDQVRTGAAAQIAASAETGPMAMARSPAIASNLTAGPIAMTACPGSTSGRSVERAAAACTRSTPTRCVPTRQATSRPTRCSGSGTRMVGRCSGIPKRLMGPATTRLVVACRTKSFARPVRPVERWSRRSGCGRGHSVSVTSMSQAEATRLVAIVRHHSRWRWSSPTAALASTQ